MRNISFAMTKQQILAQTKSVTRRLGWEFVKPFDVLQPVEKSQGLKRGETVIRLGCPIVVAGLRREPLNRMTDDLEYGRWQCVAEGFPDLSPHEFVEMFMQANRIKSADRVITRLAFSYVEPIV